MQIRHVFFDLDHTLWDFDKNSQLAYQKIFTENKIHLNLHDFLNAYKPINEKYWKLYRNDDIEKESLRFLRLKDSFTSLDYFISDVLINEVADKYIDYLSHFNFLIDDAVTVLEYLKNKYKLHIITNGFKEVQYKKLRNSNIIDYFDQVITSEEAGFKKPNPHVFTYALQKARATAKESIMIGDDFEADIEGALNKDIKPIYYCSETNRPIKIDVTTIRNLIDLKQYL